MNLQVRSRIEQIKQAKQIHGGMMNMWAIALGVKLSRMPIPSRKMREKLYRTIYGKKYLALCEDELEQPLAEYRSLNALFTRGVRPEQRPLSAARGQLVSPCDGTVQDLGALQNGTLLTAKGVTYSIDSLLPGVDTSPFENGNFSIFFLSPADCHRVFSPAEATLHEVIHVPGRRLLVHPPYQRKEFPVFSLNERMILRLRTEAGWCVLVMVAGWGVGNITFPFASHCSTEAVNSLPRPLRRDKEIRPNKRVRMSRRRVTHAHLKTPRQFEQGDWLATFELGSTVIMLTEPRAASKSYLAREQKVRYGEPVCQLLPEA